ncbi:hypothetical protein DERP_004629 [Dermatophagoides pteronyssinus]|uniref:Uncharacterized protein n=1 Tax=Dermatophagoides pteronyssinus TaxID=6956 RepID=A0ABQ8JPB2_DERPT|nr:hypothetical protein DERP_004629 [Dermatophagoides pteronyssinus]
MLGGGGIFKTNGLASFWMEFLINLCVKIPFGFLIKFAPITNCGISIRGSLTIIGGTIFLYLGQKKKKMAHHNRPLLPSIDNVQIFQCCELTKTKTKIFEENIDNNRIDCPKYSSASFDLAILIYTIPIMVPEKY